MKYVLILFFFSKLQLIMGSCTCVSLFFSLIFGVLALLVYNYGPFDYNLDIGFWHVPLVPSWEHLAMVSGGFGALFLVYPIFKCILACCGFLPGGVAAGSCAASCQSCYGDVPAGSWFSCCQSAGASGYHVFGRPG